jgi:hypothetical protein
MGYSVSLFAGTELLRAEREQEAFVAEDPLQLIGLVKLHELRGASWRPTEAEVEDFLKLVSTSSGRSGGSSASDE